MLAGVQPPPFLVCTSEEPQFYDSPFRFQQDLFSTQLNNHAFAGGFHFEFRLPFSHELAGVLDDFIHAVVIVVGVVVEKDEFLHAGLECHGDGIVHAAVSPADVLFEFGTVVLRVEDEDVGFAHEVNHRLVVESRFGIRKEGDDAVG